MAPNPESNPIAVSVASATKATGIGRTTIFALIRDGSLPAVKLGSRTLIRAADLDAFIASLPPARKGKSA
jgi:excisionase family DNA binding protein